MKYCPLLKVEASANLNSMSSELPDEDIPMIESFTDAVASAVNALRLNEMPASPQLVFPEPSVFRTCPLEPSVGGKTKSGFNLN